jgi:hypothetical protein
MLEDSTHAFQMRARLGYSDGSHKKNKDTGTLLSTFEEAASKYAIATEEGRRKSAESEMHCATLFDCRFLVRLSP